VAVGKTPGEHAGSLVRVGSENGHLVRRTQAVRCEDVVHGGSEVHLRKRAARFSSGFIRQPHLTARVRAAQNELLASMQLDTALPPPPCRARTSTLFFWPDGSSPAPRVSATVALSLSMRPTLRHRPGLQRSVSRKWRGVPAARRSVAHASRESRLGAGSRCQLSHTWSVRAAAHTARLRPSHQGLLQVTVGAAAFAKSCGSVGIHGGQRRHPWQSSSATSKSGQATRH
jgi:hypothetical protein